MAAEQKQGSVAQEGYEWLQVLIWALVAIVLVFTFLGLSLIHI